MSTQPCGADLIDRYLFARGHRHFRGHHDGEYFFILSVGHGSLSAPHVPERLHVHFEVSGPDRDTVTVRITPACFFPAADRDRLLAVTERWNRENEQITALVFESCDQSRIGVAAENSWPMAGTMPFDGFADAADNTIRSAVELLTEVTSGARPLGTWLKDAG